MSNNEQPLRFLALFYVVASEPHHKRLSNQSTSSGKNKTIFTKQKMVTFGVEIISCLKKKVLFIINPVAGGKSKAGIPDLIARQADKDLLEYDITFTDDAGHARQLAAAAVGKYDTVVAVGGDGTVNEAASGVVGTDTALGIIPVGSGNGLSRFLNIPMNLEKAFETINQHKVEVIDAAMVDGNWFFNMAGMGFDAHISEVFSHQKNRGFSTYFKSSLQEITSYKPQLYSINIDGKIYEREAFMLSFANSSQYGNNAHVSPHASVQDGLLDVCIIKPFPLYIFPLMGFRMFTKTADKSPYVEIIRGKHIQVKRQQAGPVHFDGEPHILGTETEIKVVPHSLKVIVGSAYKK
jgi:YegS/Rv2252/BmrU family lipid kinase